MKKIIFKGFSNKGFEGQAIGIETDIRNGFPGFDIIGLPDNAIRESRERIKAAMKNSGFKFPNSHVLVSLSPASVPKSGSLLDLPIALSIIFASQNTKENGNSTVSVMATGELALSGDILPSEQSMGAVECAEKCGCSFCLVPFKSGTDKNVYNVTTLTEAFLLCGEYANSASRAEVKENRITRKIDLFNGLIGMNREKEVAATAAAGRHSILLFGPPGVGKTTLSGSIVNLLGKLSGLQEDEVRHIYGCAESQCPENGIPPMRVVAHDCSMNQFASGRNPKSPGEGALAHNGVLLLDELNAYTRKLTDSVKDAYDKGMTISSRSGESTVYPACFMLVSNMNVCPCGGLGNPEGTCTCTTQKIASYWAKVGNQLIERFDIRLPIPQYTLSNLIAQPVLPDSYFSDRIQTAIERQQFRYRELSYKYNGQLHIIPGAINTYLDNEVDMLIKLNDNSRIMNPRMFNSIVTLSRTIADMDNREKITDEDLMKAIEFRQYGNGDYFWKVIR